MSPKAFFEIAKFFYSGYHDSEVVKHGLLTAYQKRWQQKFNRKTFHRHHGMWIHFIRNATEILHTSESSGELVCLSIRLSLHGKKIVKYKFHVIIINTLALNFYQYCFQQSSTTTISLRYTC